MYEKKCLKSFIFKRCLGHFSVAHHEELHKALFIKDCEEVDPEWFLHVGTGRRWRSLILSQIICLVLHCHGIVTVLNNI